MNEVEETLAFVRRQKAVLKASMKKETDRKKLSEMSDDLQLLSKEEDELLRRLGINE